MCNPMVPCKLANAVSWFQTMLLCQELYYALLIMGRLHGMSNGGLLMHLNPNVSIRWAILLSCWGMDLWKCKKSASVVQFPCSLNIVSASLVHIYQLFSCNFFFSFLYLSMQVAGSSSLYNESYLFFCASEGYWSLLCKIGACTQMLNVEMQWHTKS